MVKWLFFKPIKIFWSIVAQKNKTKAKEKVCRSNWKVSKSRGIFKHIWWDVIQEILMFRMLWNILKDGLCFLRNESVSMKVSLLNMHEATDFIRSEQAHLFPPRSTTAGHFRAKFASEADRSLTDHPKCYLNKHWC